MSDPTYTLRAKLADGTVHEIDGLTADQAVRLGNGQAIGYAPENPRILMDERGVIVHRETAG